MKFERFTLLLLLTNKKCFGFFPVWSAHRSILCHRAHEGGGLENPDSSAPALAVPLSSSSSVVGAGGTFNSGMALPSDDSTWKQVGEKIIREAAVTCGARDDQVNIRWLPGKIIVTLFGNTYLQAQGEEEEDDVLMQEIDHDDDDDLDVLAMEQLEMESTNDDDDTSLNNQPTEPMQNSGIDVVSVARAINLALGEQGEGSLPYNIAVHHEIEVTTPGASDELQGIMYESYKGFDVLVESMDPKVKDKITVTEGKLVERNDNQTIINVKGRMRKFKNDLVKSVRLPKAKREKGVK